MAEAYLTIDDSPSPRTAQLLAYLKSHDIQALFFCRGDFMEEYPDQAMAIVQQGHVLGNHLYSHQAVSKMTYEAAIQEIEKTEDLIAAIYKKAEINQPGKYLRFPYLDRGDGDKTEQRLQDIVSALNRGDHVSFPENESVVHMQNYLKEAGYSQPFHDVNHPLYKVAAIQGAFDSLVTYTSYDWMVSPRHVGQHDYKNTEDLKRKIDNDPHLLLKSSVNIVLFHDDREGIIAETCALVDHMLRQGVIFRRFV